MWLVPMMVCYHCHAGYATFSSFGLINHSVSDLNFSDKGFINKIVTEMDLAPITLTI
jgi:hypothetical protein